MTRKSEVFMNFVSNNKNKFIEVLKDSGVFLLMLFVIIMILSSVLFLIKINISKYHFVISVILTILLFYLLNKGKKISCICFSILLSILVFCGCLFVNKVYLDLSWDGNTYHKDAVGLLKNGWNPVYEDYITAYEKIGNRNMDYIGNELSTTHGFWQTYYAKGTWLIGATIYAFSDDIETGKVYNLIIIYITFVLMLSFLCNCNISMFFSLIIAVLVSFNPISIVQMFTYYNDGFLTNILILLIFYMMLFNDENRKMKNKELYISICSFLVLIINTKFTGFGYAGIFCLFFYLVFLYKMYKNNRLSDCIKPTIIFSITVILSVCIVGFSPYVKNIVEKHQIFYPLQGKDKVDIVSYNQPKQFNDKTTVYKFAKSVLSKTSNINQINNSNPELKVPFSVDEAELQSLYHPDIRVAGFGVLFSGILIISSIILFVYLIFMFIKKSKYLILILIPLIIICLLILFISESWWARYIPYLYLVPLIALFLTSLRKSKVNYLLFIMLFIPMFINILYFFQYNTLHNYMTSKEIRECLNSVPKNKRIIVIDEQNTFLGALYNLEDRNIQFSVTSEKNKNSKKLYKWIRYVEGK